MDDPDPRSIRRRLSIPAGHIAGQVSRRRFLQGTLASGAALGTMGALPGIFDGLAAAATPLGATEGVLIVLHLGGGNDGLNTVVPIGDGAYQAARGAIAIGNPLPLTSSFGFHPSLPKLKARYTAGKVAVVQGVGQSTVNDLSHFSSTASWMAGTAGSSRTTGWLGRWLDGVSGSVDGLRAVTIGSSIPLHLAGQQVVVTALDTEGDLFGADRREDWMTSVYDTVSAYGSGPTGKGVWADKIAKAGASSVGLATELTPIFTPELPDSSLTSQLTMIARLINADLGIRVFDASLGSFDTHDGQLGEQAELFADLDAAVDAFYATLAPSWTRRVAMMTFSEFGRRVEANASAGTDHGTTSCLLVIGDNVKGGMHGQFPSLTDLDDRGDTKVKVDYRSVYASVLGGWLGGDATAVLGGSYEDLKLFSATPGKTPTGPIITGPWVPFATPSDLVRQQYLDFYGRVGDPSGVAYWTSKLTSGSRTIPSVIDAFLHSTEFGRSVAPAARLALAAFGTTPAFDDLLAWAAQLKGGATVPAVAASVCAKPAFAARYGSKTDAAFVAAAYRDITGRAPSSSAAAGWTSKLAAHTATRADLVAALVVVPAAVSRFQAQVEVLMTYAGLLRRRPDASGWTYWVAKVGGGTSIQRLIAQFFASSEYRRRFAS
ncbi:MAG: hypothetical protein JWM89_1129 [Acidimicrobiales bacterium]|nr:hypothetical protein [Acidimicrobiales bacterium]